MYLFNIICLLSFLMQTIILFFSSAYISNCKPLGYIYYPLVIFYITTHYIKKIDNSVLLKNCFKYSALTFILSIIYYITSRGSNNFNLFVFFENNIIIALTLFLLFKKIFKSLKNESRLLIKCNCVMGLLILLTISSVLRNDFLVILFAVLFILEDKILLRNITLFFICLIYPLFTLDINFMFTALSIVFFRKEILNKDTNIKYEFYLLITTILILLQKIISCLIK